MGGCSRKGKGSELASAVVFAHLPYRIASRIVRTTRECVLKKFVPCTYLQIKKVHILFSVGNRWRETERKLVSLCALTHKPNETFCHRRCGAGPNIPFGRRFPFRHSATRHCHTGMLERKYPSTPFGGELPRFLKNHNDNHNDIWAGMVG